MEINLNAEEINLKLSEGNYEELRNFLKDKFQIETDSSTLLYVLKSPTSETLDLLEHILDFSVKNVEDNVSVNESLALIKQCFICLRNCAIAGTATQDAILEHSGILEICVWLLTHLADNEQHVDCLQMLLQFLGNVLVANERTQIVVWNTFSDIFLNLLSFMPADITHVLTMILYNILRCHRHLLPENLTFLKDIIDLFAKGNEFSEFLLELIVPSNMFLKLYPELTSEEKLIVFEILHDQTFLTSEIPSDFIALLSSEFKRKSDCILKTVTDYLNEIEPIEVKGLLDVLATVSGIDTYLPILQSDKSLLINCIFLLKSIHEIGKVGENDFSTIQKLSKLSITDNGSSIENHPGFGFKAHLIRIIGNLCWRHSENQKEVRELECMQLLLDCCNIDARNPFIIQWVTLAIRNLCENNPENQAIIAATTKVGTVDSETLHQMGVVLNDDRENTIRIVPLERQ